MDYFSYNALSKKDGNYSAPHLNSGVLNKTNRKCSGLSHLWLGQGEKAQFSGLNAHFSTME